MGFESVCSTVLRRPLGVAWLALDVGYQKQNTPNIFVWFGNIELETPRRMNMNELCFLLRSLRPMVKIHGIFFVGITKSQLSPAILDTLIRYISDIKSDNINKPPINPLSLFVFGLHRGKSQAFRPPKWPRRGRALRSPRRHWRRWDALRRRWEGGSVEKRPNIFGVGMWVFFFFFFFSDGLVFDFFGM